MSSYINVDIIGSLANSEFFETLGCGITFLIIVGAVKTDVVSLFTLTFIAVKKLFSSLYLFFSYKKSDFTFCS
ncbi:hypothetical protein D3C85_1311620 [compost metagenome]